MNSTLYQKIAEAVRTHPGSPELVKAIYDVVRDEVESLAADRVDELLHRSDELVADTRNPTPDVNPAGHTEVEAGQRWCPHAREATPVGKGKKDIAIGNRYLTMKDDYPNPAGARCIASHCMSWRWAGAERGYCGLAGPVLMMPAREPRQLHDRVPPARTYDLFDHPQT
jgi:hypothetical protein